jgi:group I intron endonuclease
MEFNVLEKEEYNKVTGVIYRITNTVTNKHYIGQTRSHRLNRGKYRPFGHIGRFKDHISETYSNKKHTCKYLNSSIAKYGKTRFVCEVILYCKLDELDRYEQHFIKEYDSKYPNGYNLTDGGQGCVPKGAKVRVSEDCVVNVSSTPETPPRIRSEETRQNISRGIKSAINGKDHLTHMMKLVQNQHLEKKFDILKDVEIDQSNIEQYVSVISNSKTNTQYVQISFGRKRRVSFVGKHEPIENTKERAFEFLRELIKRGETP